MNKTIIIITIAILLASVTLAGVIFLPYNPRSPPRANDTNSSQSGVAQVVKGNNRFAINLYKELSKEDTDNILFSPYSVSSAMAIVYEGAGGKTAEEIKDVFGFPSYDILRPNFARVYNDFNNRKNCTLRTGNALWINENFKINKNFESIASEYYGGKAATLDFSKPDHAREIINKFIAEQTNYKINELIPEGVLSGEVELVITNAVYFNGTWENKFDSGETLNRSFWISENKSIKVPTMHKYNMPVSLSEASNVELVRLKYRGNFSFVILLPKNSSLEDVERKLSYEWVKNLEDEESEQNVDLFMPKFKFRRKEEYLEDELRKLGIKKAFSPFESNLSNMYDHEYYRKKRLYISQVIHEAYIDVSESGTEAAAATAVIIKATASAVPPKIKVVKVDHPFIFFIQDDKTGEILFMGRVTNPKSE